MRKFACPHCGATVFFGNDHCGNCSSYLVYDVDRDGFMVAAADEDASSLPARCANHRGPSVCNWVAGADGLCAGCRLDEVADRSPLVALFQTAKRRTLRQLRSFGLEPTNLTPSLRFALLESTDDERVSTGHNDGLITLDVSEGDTVRMAAVRAELGEHYRTPLGHVRHEIGHWYWAAFVDNSQVLNEFRLLFGDERADYSEALEQHYASIDSGEWRVDFITHYASAHPWEDFAESFAHYLLMTDALETARSFPLAETTAELATGLDFASVNRAWLELTTVLNELNRSTGVPDAYPFAPSPPAVQKIAWIHRHLTGAPETTPSV